MEDPTNTAPRVEYAGFEKEPVEQMRQEAAARITQLAAECIERCEEESDRIHRQLMDDFWWQAEALLSDYGLADDVPAREIAGTCADQLSRTLSHEVIGSRLATVRADIGRCEAAATETGRLSVRRILGRRAVGQVEDPESFRMRLQKIEDGYRTDLSGPVENIVSGLRRLKLGTLRMFLPDLAKQRKNRVQRWGDYIDAHPENDVWIY